MATRISHRVRVAIIHDELGELKEKLHRQQFSGESVVCGACLVQNPEAGCHDAPSWPLALGTSATESRLGSVRRAIVKQTANRRDRRISCNIFMKTTKLRRRGLSSRNQTGKRRLRHSVCNFFTKVVKLTCRGLSSRDQWSKRRHRHFVCIFYENGEIEVPWVLSVRAGKFTLPEYSF